MKETPPRSRAASAISPATISQPWETLVEEFGRDIQRHVTLLQTCALQGEQYQTGPLDARQQRLLSQVMERIREAGARAFTSTDGSAVIVNVLTLLRSMAEKELVLDLPTYDRVMASTDEFTILDALGAVKFMLLCLCGHLPEHLSARPARRVILALLDVLPPFISYEMQLLDDISAGVIAEWADEGTSVIGTTTESRVAHRQLRRPSLRDTFVYFFGVVRYGLGLRLFDEAESIVAERCFHVLNGYLEPPEDLQSSRDDVTSDSAFRSSSRSDSKLMDVVSTDRGRSEFQGMFFEVPDVFKEVFCGAMEDLRLRIAQEPLKYALDKSASPALQKALLFLATDSADCEELSREFAAVYLPTSDAEGETATEVLDELLVSSLGARFLGNLLTVADAASLQGFVWTYLHKHQRLNRVAATPRGQALICKLLSSPALEVVELRCILEDLDSLTLKDSDIMQHLLQACSQLQAYHAIAVSKFMKAKGYESPKQCSTFWRATLLVPPEDASMARALQFPQETGGSPSVTNEVAMHIDTDWDGWSINEVTCNALKLMFHFPHHAVEPLLEALPYFIDDLVLLKILGSDTEGSSLLQTLLQSNSPVPLTLQRQLAASCSRLMPDLAFDVHGRGVVKSVYRVASLTVKEAIASAIAPHARELSRLNWHLFNIMYLDGYINCRRAWTKHETRRCRLYEKYRENLEASWRLLSPATSEESTSTSKKRPRLNDDSLESDGPAAAAAAATGSDLLDPPPAASTDVRKRARKRVADERGNGYPEFYSDIIERETAEVLQPIRT